MSDYPELPSDRVLDLLDEYEEEVKCWRITWDISSQRFDLAESKTVYDYVWLEYLPRLSHLDRSKTVAVEEKILCYRVPTESYQYVIRAKSLEKALESYR